MTQLAAGFAAKGLLNLMTNSPVATGLAYFSTHNLILSNFHSESDFQSYTLLSIDGSTNHRNEIIFGGHYNHQIR